LFLIYGKEIPNLSVIWVGMGFGQEVCMIAVFLSLLKVSVCFHCYDLLKDHVEEAQSNWKSVQSGIKNKGNFAEISLVIFRNLTTLVNRFGEN
jgi:hypothetical protein